MGEGEGYGTPTNTNEVHVISLYKYNKCTSWKFCDD